MKKMTKQSSLFITLVSLSLLLSMVGCDSITAIVVDKKNQLEKSLKDSSLLARARNQLSDIQKSRNNMKSIADKFHVDSEVSVKEINRLEEGKEKTLENFNKLQDAAKNAELPKYADATSADKMKSLQIGTKTFTGEEIYRTLREYKNQIEKVNLAIERKRKQSDFFKERAEKIRSQLPRVDENIAKIEQKIADIEMYQELLTATKSIESLGLSDGKIDELLNTDSITAELQKVVDESDVKLEMSDQENRGTELMQELDGGSSFSITGDDLI